MEYISEEYSLICILRVEKIEEMSQESVGDKALQLSDLNLLVRSDQEKHLVVLLQNWPVLVFLRLILEADIFDFKLVLSQSTGQRTEYLGLDNGADYSQVRDNERVSLLGRLQH